MSQAREDYPLRRTLESATRPRFDEHGGATGIEGCEAPGNHDRQYGSTCTNEGGVPAQETCLVR